jgi:hypothetical protein
MVDTRNPSPEETEQENGEFDIGLGYIGKPCLKEKRQEATTQWLMRSEMS